MYNLSFKPENSQQWVQSGNIYVNKKDETRLDLVLDPTLLPPPGPDGKIRITAFPRKPSQGLQASQPAQATHTRPQYSEPRLNRPAQPYNGPRPQGYSTRMEDDIPF